jgi:hypothetical protein
VFENEDLKSHLQSSFNIDSGSALIAEWNMNVPGNVFKLGNYRYRKSGTNYNAIPDSFDRTDSGRYYTNALNSDVVVESGFKDNTSTPLLFQ